MKKLLTILVVLCLGVMFLPVIEDADATVYTIDLKSDYWNFKSYVNNTVTYPELLINDIPYCLALVGLNATGFWKTYWPSISLTENWTINPGDGLFILVSQDTTWYVTVGSPEYETGDLTVTGDLSVSENVFVDGNLTANGTLSYNNLTLTENLTVGGNITGATGRTADFVVVASDAPQHWLNQGDYFCDGSDDQVEINVAFENCSTGWGKVVLSGGTFDISDTIEIPYGATLEGQGMGRNYGDATNDIRTLLDWTGGAKDIVFYNSANITQKYTVAGNGIYDLTIDGNGMAGSTGIRVRNSYHHTIRDVTIVDTEVHGIHIEASFGENILDCAIIRPGYNGIFLAPSPAGIVTTHVEIRGCEISSADSYNINITSAKAMITNNWFENGVGGTGVHIVVSPNSSSDVEVWITDNMIGGLRDSLQCIQIKGGSVRINHNYIDYSGVDRDAINLTGGRLQMEGNELYSWENAGGTAVNISGGDFIHIKDNIFRASTTSDYCINITVDVQGSITGNSFASGGIYTNSYNLLITGNRFYNIYTDYAIYCIDPYCAIENNQINNPYYNGIYVSDKSQVIGNMIINAGQQTDDTYDAIYVGGDETIINNNYIYSNHANKPRYGIYVPYGNNDTISGNYISGSSTYNLYLQGGSTNKIIGNTFYNKTVSITGSFTNSHIIKDNIGYVTENTGYNASITNGFTVTHGLAGTPTSITITLGQNSTVWITAKDATTFTVGLPTGTYDIYWYAIYKP